MKIAQYVLFVTVVAACSLNAQQVSDRVIVEKFSSTMKELTKNVDAAQSAHDCAEIGASIDALEKEYASHKELLDRALYPDDYSKTIINLKGRLLVRQKDIGVIETQIIRITALESQVRELSGKIDELTKENEKLLAGVENLKRAHALNMEALAMDKAAMDSLKSVIAKLQKNLRERDNLIFALVDSLFMQYDKDVASMNDVEKQRVSVRFERKNVLTNIKKSLSDNITFVESTGLAPNDYAEIARQNQRFASQWKGIGSKIAAIYLSGKQRKNETAVIDTMLATWSAKVNEATWKAIAALFEKGGVQVKPFSSGDELTRNFSEFVAAEMRNEKKESNDAQRKRYNTFNEQVWSTDLEKTWLPALVESAMLTADQKAEIEKSFESWGKAVTPVSPMVYIFGAVVLIIILWSLTRRMRKKSAAKSS